MMCREFESRRLHNLFFSRLRAGDIINGYDSVTPVAFGEGKAPEISVTKSTRQEKPTYLPGVAT